MYEQLIKDCLKGKRTAQNQFYQQFYGKMMAVCMRYASHQEEAREILNMGFYKVFTRLKQFDQKQGNLDGWIYRIMVNTSIDYIRSEMRHQNKVELDQTAPLATEEDTISKLSAEEIIALVQQLTPAYRSVFNLYVMEGYNHREIGEKLGISEGTSKSNLSKARMRLQEMIRKQFSTKQQPYAEF